MKCIVTFALKDIAAGMLSGLPKLINAAAVVVPPAPRHPNPNATTDGDAVVNSEDTKGKRQIVRKLRDIAAAAIVVLSAAFIAPSGAIADVPWGQTAHVYMNFDDAPSRSQQSQYFGLINSLRQAAGHVFREGTYSTQFNTTGIIRLSLHRNGTDGSVDFWITPYDLYLRGFTVFVNGENITWQFAGGNLREILQRNGPDWAAQRVNTLPFSVNYADIERWANTSRTAMQYDYNRFVSLYEELRRAAWAGPGGETA